MSGYADSIAMGLCRESPVQYSGYGEGESTCFRTPWHWYIHGLGLGQYAGHYDPCSAECLLQASRALHNIKDSPLHGFTHKLLYRILTQGGKASVGVRAGETSVEAVTDIASFRLEGNPAHYIQMATLLVSCLDKAGMLEDSLPGARRHLALAFATAEQLPEQDDRARYEKLQLMSRLFMAATHIHCTQLIHGEGGEGTSYVRSALQLAGRIENRFLKGRGTAIMLTAIGLAGAVDYAGADVETLVTDVLTDLDHQIQNPQTYRDDGVHSGLDYQVFPLSLMLNALPALGLEHFVGFRRNWLDTAVDLFDRLSPDSRASQVLFLVSALDGLGQRERYFPDKKDLLVQCVDDYLADTNGTRPDDYLRCTYLVHLAVQLESVESLNPRIQEILSGTLMRRLQRGGKDGGARNKYQSDTMLAAYSLSAFARLGQLETLFGSRALLPELIGRLEPDSDEFRCDSPKLCLALIDAALRLVPDAYSRIHYKTELSEMMV